MQATGQDLPEEWKCPVNPAAELVWVWNAFMDLTTCRRVERGPIPHPDIKDYALQLGITGIGFEVFKNLIRSLDRELLEHTTLKEKRAAAKQNRG